MVVIIFIFFAFCHVFHYPDYLEKECSFLFQQCMYVMNYSRKSKLLSCFQAKIILANHEWFQRKIFFSSFVTCPNQGNHFASFFQWNPLRHHTIHRRKNYSLNRFREKNKLWTSFFPQLKTWRNNTSKYKTITRACGFIELSSNFSKNKQLYF